MDNENSDKKPPSVSYIAKWLFFLWIVGVFISSLMIKEDFGMFVAGVAGSTILCPLILFVYYLYTKLPNSIRSIICGALFYGAVTFRLIQRGKLGEFLVFSMICIAIAGVGCLVYKCLDKQKDKEH